MATTTNYGWTTPDDTALVKDGASAIRTLGSSVDTTTKALNPETTLGDLAYRSSTANVKTRLGLGTAGQVLQVNSGATAPEWATISSGGMTLISTTTFNGSPTTTLSSIPQTYNDLKIIIKNYLPATDATTLHLRLNSDANTRYVDTPFGTNTTGSGFNADKLILMTLIDNATTQSLAIIDIQDYTNSVTWKATQSYAYATNSTGPTGGNVTLRTGLYNQTSAITSLDFFYASGNATSGTILLYGVK